MRLNSYFHNIINEIIEEYANENSFNEELSNDTIEEILNRSISSDVPDSIKIEMLRAIKIVIILSRLNNNYNTLVM